MSRHGARARRRRQGRARATRSWVWATRDGHLLFVVPNAASMHAMLVDFARLNACAIESVALAPMCIHDDGPANCYSAPSSGETLRIRSERRVREWLGAER